MRDIKNPDFLKKLNSKELEKLSYEIREFLIDNISKTGGHLSSNLGIVDLTIAIHKVFDSPKDKIIFDVGHQSYTHKILTGRAKDFKSLRQHNGLSGFQKREESIHDCYEAGHSSTSLSAALGFALARDMDKKKHNVVAIIGDGSIGNGLAYEALNHIGSTDTKLIVILNDNEMSISKNVGALHNTLDKIRSNYKYDQTKKKTKGVIKKIPYLGKTINNSITGIKESIKKLYMKEGYLFEEFGFDYYGPINGHDYDEMLLYLEMAKKNKKPVLVHVITEKGKGYKYAHEDTEGVWHGISPFNKETGKVISTNNKPTWSNVISNHLINLAEKDKDIVCITPAMANGAKLNEFKNKFEKRFIDVGIAEEHALVLANSMALEGKKPFVSLYSTFLQRGYDQINHDIARMKGNVVIGIDRAGIVGEDGETHQGVFDIPLLSHIPNMVIMSPHDSITAGNMLYTAFNSNMPCAIRYSRNKLDYKVGNYKKIEIGKWKTEKFGNDAYIITYGEFINNAIKIRDNLLKDNIDLTVINALFIKPFDTKLYRSILNDNKPIIIYEESSNIGSLGSILTNYALNNGYTPKIKCYGIKDEFIKQGKCDIIIKELGLDIDTMTNNIKEYLGGK
ncbi:MAG: 1-deoxy-D-xylulose-5-phosphate synthase [Bacilli bacterium]|nr:1-deoxy-D-xylulose-5-phosphate synthase [Bacilli bacterium]